ncbi:PIG-L family deacetylase [Microbacterium sp. BK668]|uniref:PIG-L family deacetylase n=1 Tax=Microbacterium sp. BK668 TaxID=2512118 RepID=UPI00105BCBD2|nr:PIG-L family deacetylase [Microbacterium sp. BK668]TDN92229.1 LmbE family N-acetylglucosaminyl deacetylase [Microbacterium sp. BK668]
MTGFSHLEAGTSEALWRAELSRRRLRPLDTSFDVLIVVAAHPDDETLGASGLMRRAARSGGRVIVAVASDGEASHPGSPTHDAAALARRRREEVRRAVAHVAPDAEVLFFGLPDGRLASAKASLANHLTAMFDRVRATSARRVLVAAPWAQDRHGDHRAVAETSGDVAGRRRFRYVEYPIWAWHWGVPDDLPWERMVALALTDEEQRAKRHALAVHSSQTEPLSDQPGDEPLLHEGMQAHFHRPVELFVEAEVAQARGQSLDAAWFDDFYRRNGADPWGFETRWYEERKRALLLAALPTAELGDVLEIGCASGLLTRDLSRRARHVLAMDAATTAVETARRRLGGETRVTVRQGSVPADWPTGRFDTIVFSEVGYYLAPDDLRRTLALIEASLSADGCVVACHWRHPVAAYPQTGDDVHDALRAVAAWEVVASHVERDFILDVFTRRPARSVAEREGLL